jgi:23S rRNA (uracil1939-C5)-methyltransferase
MGKTFRLSPLSFYQINRSQAEKLYQRALEYADLHGSETVLDLYCGTGTIGLVAAKKCARVTGAEIVEAAVADARENARRNGVTNADFLCADAAEAARLFAERGEAPDVIVVDPPRKGLDPSVIASIRRMAPERVVYVSCDPGTLARDLKRFAEPLSPAGTGADAAPLPAYAPARLCAADMFPRTRHCEAVVQLSKGNISRETIRLEFDLEDAKMSGFRRKATYEDI